VVVSGTVDPAFEPMREAFAANFAPTPGDEDGLGADPGELGAALCVIVDGRVVVDLWGGWADLAGTRAWEADTLVNAYSIGKAVSAATVLAVVSDGALDLDAPVARVWPEFAAHGKGAITLRQLLSHQGGLPGVRRPVADDEVFDFPAVAAALAAQATWWEPGTAHGYHVNTLGHLVGEPVRRVTGDRFGAAVRDRVARPLGADVWIGLPREEHRRVAEVDFVQHVPEEWRPHAGDDDRSRMRRATYFNPEGLSGIGTVNLPRWREAEVPSTNLHASARGVAGVFASLADGSPAGGLLAGSLVEEATTTASRGTDLVLDRESHFGLGMMLHLDSRPIGIGPGSFGHYGNGGSLGFGDRSARVGFGYVMNRPGDRWQVPRTRRLLDALGEVLGG
jgi:CubicO group peptidase (beta-lactamase class C family)